MLWWQWLVVSLGLFGVEMLTPGVFFFVFFGAGAFVAAFTTAVETTPEFWQQALVFSLCSMGSLLAFRKQLLQRLPRKGAAADIDALVGEYLVLDKELSGSDVGRAEFRGSLWSVRSSDMVPLRAGQRCRIERVSELTLWVKGE